MNRISGATKRIPHVSIGIKAAVSALPIITTLGGTASAADADNAPAWRQALGSVDIYAGAFGGIGSSRMESDHTAAAGRVYPVREAHPTSALFGAYGGLGWRFLAIEGGWVRLPGYTGYAVGVDPPRSAHQKIGGDATFGRVLLRAPFDWPVKPYAFGGVAMVYGKNHELGQCPTCGAGYVPDWHNWTRVRRPYVGLGAEVPIVPHFAVRAELGYIPHAIDSFWTGNRDYTLGSISLQVRF